MSRRVIEARARIFVGCEGESEDGYATFLATLARDLGLPVAVDPHILKNGDPLSRLQWAVACVDREQKKRGAYVARFAFLDTDQRDLVPGRSVEIATLARQHDITLIWQEPDHEGLLLQHFDHKERKRPATKAESMKAVLRVWNGYEKNSTARQYARALSREHLTRAADRHEALRCLLAEIGLVEPPPSGMQ